MPVKQFGYWSVMDIRSGQRFVVGDQERCNTALFIYRYRHPLKDIQVVYTAATYETQEHDIHAERRKHIKMAYSADASK